MNEGGDVRRRIAVALRRYAVEGLPSKKHRDYFGCSQKFLRDFLELQLGEGMSWKRFGVDWKVGHVLAVSHFDMTKELDRRLCWNWANLRVVSARQARATLSAGEALNIFSERAVVFRENEVIMGLCGRAYDIVRAEMKLKAKGSVKPLLRELKSHYPVEDWGGRGKS